MEQNKYLKLHSFLRMGAALIAIIVFISMFITKQIVHSELDGVFLEWTEAFFGEDPYKATVLGFIGYLFVIIGGLAGLAFVFIDEMIGKDLTKKLSYVAGGVMVLGGIFMLLTGVIFRAVNSDGFGIKDYQLAAGPIVFGILAIVAGLADVTAPILEDKGL